MSKTLIPRIPKNLTDYGYTFWLFSLCAVVIFSFTSISFSSLHHIFLAIGTLFLFKEVIPNIKELPKSAYLLLGLIIWGIIANLSNYLANPLKSFSPIKYYLFSIIALIAYKILISRNKLNAHLAIKLLFAFLIITSIASLSGLIAYAFDYNPLKFREACHPERACGLFGMYMSYGYAIQFVVILIIGLFIFAHKININRYFLTGVFIINFVGLYLSFCRGAIIGLLAAVPFFFLRQHQKWFLRLAIVLPIMAIISFFTSSTINGLFTDPDRLKSNNERLSQYMAVFYSAQENPLLGVGFRNFEHRVQNIKRDHNLPHAEMAGHAHNNFLEHLAATGIPGFLLIIFFHLLWFWEMLKRADFVGDISIPIIIALVVSGQFQYTMGDAGVMFFLMTFYALSHQNLTRNTRGVAI